MKKFILLSLITVFVLESCNSNSSSIPTDEETSIFKKNVETFQIWKKSHEVEDVGMFMEILSDTLQWSPPNYDGKILGKEDLKAALSEVYFPLFENIKFTEGVGLPFTQTHQDTGGFNFFI